MAELIYRSSAQDVPRWSVVRQPGQVTDPMVVEFLKFGRTKLLNQTARWDGNGWDPKRWVPKTPQVPKALLLKVEAHMRRVQP